MYVGIGRMICFLLEFGGLAFVNVGMSVWFCLQKCLFWAIICIIVWQKYAFLARVYVVCGRGVSYGL